MLTFRSKYNMLYLDQNVKGCYIEESPPAEMGEPELLKRSAKALLGSPVNLISQCFLFALSLKVKVYSLKYIV